MATNVIPELSLTPLTLATWSLLYRCAGQSYSPAAKDLLSGPSEGFQMFKVVFVEPYVELYIMYWVGQIVHLGFFIQCYGKTQMNCLANPVILLLFCASCSLSLPLSFPLG